MTGHARAITGLLLALAAAAGAAGPAGAQNSEFVDKGPSFNCASVRDVTRKLICRHEELAGLDLELDEAFKAAQRRTGGGGGRAIRREQLRWIAKRNRCGAQVECLLTAYYHRIEELTQTDETAARSLGGQAEGAVGMNPIANVEVGFDEAMEDGPDGPR
jgi:uncharacterized protein